MKFGEMVMQGTSPRVRVTKSTDFKQIYSIGANGGFTPFDFRLGFYNDMAAIDDSTGKMTINRITSVEIIMSPVAAKALVKWLNGHITAFEKQFGKISDVNQLPTVKNQEKQEDSEGSASMWT